MSTPPASLGRLIWLVRCFAVLGALALTVGQALLWTHEEWVAASGFALSGVPKELMIIDTRARVLGALGSAPGTLVSLYGLWQLWRLFGGYSAGSYFVPAAQARLRRFAWALLIAAILEPLERTWMSIAFTIGNPPGKRMLTVAFSSSDFMPIVTAAVLLAVALVLSEASRISEENKLFV